MGAFAFGYWIGAGAGCYYPDCYYSPFYYYGFPYVYAPRTQVVEVPVYTYTEVPSYEYGNGYYLSPGQYSGLNAAVDDIKAAWTDGSTDLLQRHIDPNTQVAVYLNGAYLYSLSGTDYSNMVRDAMSHIRTVSFTTDKVEQRSDGAFTVDGTHQFYDVNNNLKTVSVSFTFSQMGNRWIIVAAGSSETS